MPKPSWTDEEDVALVRACLTLFTDPLREQSDYKFWHTVFESLYSEQSQPPRTIGGLRSRWMLLSRHCGHFADCVSHLADELEGNVQEDELVDDATTLFRKTTGHRFQYLTGWRLLKDWPQLRLYRLDAGVKGDAEAAAVVDAALAVSRRRTSEKKKKHCGCTRKEGCAACGRCVERHCVCGMSPRRRRALCLESRACSCPLPNPADRCRLCHGCRRVEGDGHCRCTQHQKLLWLRRHPEIELTEEEDKNRCSCLQLSDEHRSTGRLDRREDVLDKRERLRRVKRAGGLPSRDNAFRKKIAVRLGDEGVESDFDDGEFEAFDEDTRTPTAREELPGSMARSLLGFQNPPPYHPLFRSEGNSLLETIEPRNERMRTMREAANQSSAVQQEVSRGLDNLTYELDRTANMPPDDLVDFMVYLASLKASHVGELIGTFEDSAAIAASIIVEEYMMQLVEDVAVNKKALCPPSEESVAAFTRELLTGFNWRLFQQQNPCTSDDMVNKLAALVLKEFTSVQSAAFDVAPNSDEVTSWIRKAIVIPSNESLSRTAESSSPADEDTGQESKADAEDQNREGQQAAPRMRITVKPHPVIGTPEYNLSFATELEDGHHVDTCVGGIQSKPQALATIQRLSRVVERHNERSRNVAPPSPPSDPYASMWAFVKQIVNASLQREQESKEDDLSDSERPQKRVRFAQ